MRTLLLRLAVLACFGLEGIALGTMGILRTSIHGFKDNAYAVTTQPDGKLIVVGSALNSMNLDVVVVRYDTKGNIDGTFGNRGFAISDFGSDEEAYAVALQADGKIVVVGAAKVPNEKSKAGDYDMLIVRYQANGMLDETFGTRGKFTQGFGTGDDKAYGVGITTSQEIVVAGTGTFGKETDTVVFQLLSNGKLNEKYGTSNPKYEKPGFAITQFGLEDYANSLLMQADNKVIVAGNSKIGRKNYITIARYTTAGELDEAYGNKGKILLSMRGTHDNAFGLTLQNDGRLLVGGSTSSGSNLDFGIVRYHAEGNLDFSFATYGKKIARVAKSISQMYAIGTQPDGKIVVAGSYFSDADQDFNSAVVRFTPKGGLDPSFGKGGRMLIKMDPKYDAIYAMSMQKDGSFYTAGTASHGAGYEFCIARFLSTGALDENFGGDAKRAIAGRRAKLEMPAPATFPEALTKDTVQTAIMGIPLLPPELDPMPLTSIPEGLPSTPASGF